MQRSLGKLLLAASALTVACVSVRLAWLIQTYGLGFDLSGIWKIWGGWILLWLLVTLCGFLLLAVKRA